MTKPILYSTGCPLCTMLETKLRSSEIEYEKNTDAEKMIAMGFTQVPMLQVGENDFLTFPLAMSWVSKRTKEGRKK